jgi:DNA-binding response OmpR family regulator
LNLKILHVEDEDAHAFLLQAALDKAAIPNRVFRVSTGEDALAFLFRTGAYADAESPHLVVLDIGLPRVDGWSVLSTMKKQRHLKEIPVVVLSSSELESDSSRALELGAHRYVVKQPSVGALSEALLDAAIIPN